MMIKEWRESSRMVMSSKTVEAADLEVLYRWSKRLKVGGVVLAM